MTSQLKLDVPLRMAISGAAGFGKTTLSNRVAEFYNIAHVPEFSRQILEEEGITKPYEYPEKKGGVLGFQQQIFERKENVEGDLIAAGDSFIGDRAMLDCSAYTLFFYAKHEEQKRVLDLVYGGIEWTKQTYNVVFLMPFRLDHFQTNFDYDGIRSDKIGYHAMVYHLILGLLEEHGIPYIKLDYNLDTAFHQIQGYVLSRLEVAEQFNEAWDRWNEYRKQGGKIKTR